MKKIILLALILLLCCGCSSVDKTSSYSESEIVIRLPTDDSVNGYRSSSNVSIDGNDISGGTYRANINSQKFHTADCSYGKKIDEENLYTSNSREDMLSKGYEPCKRCKP